ncbi:MAG: hypothetical protein ACOWWH_03050 [Eubacteriaceae bacterium]
MWINRGNFIKYSMRKGNFSFSFPLSIFVFNDLIDAIDDVVIIINSFTHYARKINIFNSENNYFLFIRNVISALKILFIILKDLENCKLAEIDIEDMYISLEVF